MRVKLKATYVTGTKAKDDKVPTIKETPAGQIIDIPDKEEALRMIARGHAVALDKDGNEIVVPTNGGELLLNEDGTPAVTLEEKDEAREKLKAKKPAQATPPKPPVNPPKPAGA